MTMVLLDSEIKQILIYIGIYIAAIVFVVGAIGLSLKLKYLSHIIGIIFAAGISAGYFFRDKVFPMIFNIQSYEELEDFNEIKYLGIFLSICTFIWLLYSSSAAAIKQDDEGSYYLVWSSVDGKSNKWSVLGRWALIELIVAAVVGFGVAWLSCDIWVGFAYILSGVEIIAGIVLMFTAE